MNVAEKVRKMYREELLFYSKYHQNTTNWTIHALTIPMEWISCFMILCYFNLEWLVAVIVAAYYLLIQTKMSTQSAASQFLIAWLSRYLFNNMTINTIICLIFLVQILSWFFQVIIGHRIFEGNLPAMATKLSLNSVILSMLLCWDC
jgi:uncharacterized membrane protein YGL010W